MILILYFHTVIFNFCILFPEPETQVYQDLSSQIKFDGFLSLHAGIQQIYIPFAGNPFLSEI